MVFERPKKAGQAKQIPANPQTNTGKIKKIITVGNSNSGTQLNQNSTPPLNRSEEPSPWLDADNEPSPDKSASFVEYLRWMRPAENSNKDGTKVQILQMAENNANYSTRLQQLNKRTELIAGKDNIFQVKSTWRIRVGGHRGPESILLPAFDALGIPYIPSSTLRGVARTQAILEIIKTSGVSWKEAEKQVAAYFGSVETNNKSDQAGKVIFLDAYPLPNQSGILAVDMANNIWKWEGDLPEYNPNPNPFLSIKEATFLIGLRLSSTCRDTQVLDKVKQWLITGLQAGIGSQINTGYGELIRPGKITRQDEFFRIEFTLQGQLIHGRQKFTRWNWNDKKQEWQMRGQADAEVRPTAFKSMLRYWFRAFASGVLDTGITQEWEGKLFGAINPSKQRGWVKLNILDGKVTQKEPRPNREGKNDACGEQQGILTLSYSPGIPRNQQVNLQKLFKNLTWLMFYLGGIGQGARRPCYSRQNRQAAPWWRGSTLIPESEDILWELPKTVQEFQKLFQKRLQDFYSVLAELTQVSLNYHQLKEVGISNTQEWSESVDKNCQIIICSGEEDFNKVYALAILHHQDLKVKNKKGYLDYDPNLCGKVFGKAKPSPVWVADLENYQVVTIFGANSDPRKQYLQELKSCTNNQSFTEIFPF
jgi:CRISPR-associated protein Cmr6